MGDPQVRPLERARARDAPKPATPDRVPPPRPATLQGQRQASGLTRVSALPSPSNCRTVPSMTKSARVELRLHPDDDAMIRRAAAHVHQSVNTFVAGAARAAAERVVLNRSFAIVDADEFDELMLRLDEPPAPNKRLSSLLDSSPPWVDERAAAAPS